MFFLMIPCPLDHVVGHRSTRVSNELGAGRPQAARLAARVVVLLALIVGMSEGLVIVLVRDLWGYAYNNEEEVTRYTARMMPVLAVSVMLDGQQCVLSGSSNTEQHCVYEQNFNSMHILNCGDQVLLGAVAAKRPSLSSTLLPTTSLVSLPRLFSPSSAVSGGWYSSAFFTSLTGNKLVFTIYHTSVEQVLN